MFDEAIPAGSQGWRAPAQQPYVERPERREKALDALAAGGQAWLVEASAAARARRLRRILPLVERHGPAFRGLGPTDLPAAIRRAAIDLRRAGDFRDEAVAQAFALIRELSDRILGKRHYDVQLLGAFAMTKGMLAQMATGEGKTLTATLVAGVAGLAGVPIHVVTVNDYLAKRDAELMEPLYDALGLSVGVVVSGQDLAERQAAYAKDIVYCTNKELAFDYLRDRMVLGQSPGDLTLKAETLHDAAPRLRQLRLRGLHFALIDEADSVLIDEARTPLIISGPAPSIMDRDTVSRALQLAASLEAGADYTLSTEERRVTLTERGSLRVADFAQTLSRDWRGAVSREELARQALTAVKLFNRDEHYVVADGKVKIVDEYTGRLMPDRFWSDGLHQMIEYKEGCDLSERRATIARMTYQRFFRRYRRLCGMSGTLQSIERELWKVYRVPVVAIPTNKPVLRVQRPDVVLDTDESKWRGIVERVSHIHQTGAPVLIGARSVAASLEASAHLDAAGLAHMVLNATQNEWEASIIAQAGQRGRITIATNMAGRGTDIHLGEGVQALGGLHVIMTERHEARRIDQQLGGRSGRQGEPGSFEAILSLEDRLLEGATPLLTLATKLLRGRAGAWLARRASRLTQRRAERLHARMRADLLKSDEWQMKTLAFSGKSE